MIRTKTRMLLCALLLTGLLAFIWGNSLVDGTASGAMSGRLTALILRLLSLDNSSEALLQLLIRKAAHFTEFACLGVLLAWMFGMMGEKNAHLFSTALLCGILVACVDETIQVFVPRRGPSLIDVWIDTAGVAAGIALVLIGHPYIRNKHKSLNLEETT